MRKRVWIALALASCGDGGANDDVAVDAAPDAPPADLQGLHPADVSMLIPLDFVTSDWLNADAPARGGALVPSDLRELVVGDSFHVAGTPVQAVRLDPCFRGVADDACQPQLRLVLGPPLADVAFHAMYALTEAELDGLLQTLAQLRRDHGSPDATPWPLQRHDILAAEALAGGQVPFVETLRAAILAVAGPANLVRLTHASSSAGQLGGGPVSQSWEFATVMPGGVLVGNAAGDLLQELRVTGGDPFGFDLETTTTIEQPLALVADSDLMLAAELGDLQSARSAIQALEDPHQTLPDEVTCGGCHVAAPLRHALDELRLEPWPTDPFEAATPAGEVMAGFLSPDSIGEAFRIFSYWIGDPMISRRAIRETAEVLQAVHARGQ